jgi:tRNA threonylcarbamoyladenosine dehydratase
MRFDRTRLLVGDEGVERLRHATVAILGLGGVGGYAFEAVARAGVGRLILADCDTVDSTNINRQILALDDTVGRPKVELARERLGQINPGAKVEVIGETLRPQNIETLVPDTGYAIDALDMLDTKVALLAMFHRRGTPHVACMGAASRLSPTNTRVGDLSEVRHCRLARRVRQRLRKQGIEHGIRCVYSDEVARQGMELQQGDGPGLKRVRGTIAYVPGLVGLTAAGLIINDILAG